MMLYNIASLNYNVGGVRRRGAHYTDAPVGCKAPDRKKFQKIQLVDSAGLLPTPGTPTGLSKADISGFNTPMPNFFSIYTKVNPS
ncbi:MULTISPECIES: hypothetical protein [Pseudomonas]|uniref:hypothetical protein n=1 Tax=Pseudomonas TaxID=286 RepID=UPI001CE4AC73|nr:MULTISPECIES: hypothetical protein [Pseudomonas]MCO7516230.1 hypothetical protein [Pseudomonas putida]MCO7594434.1 hypothetical protein [Pseudomonas guariconensis]MCU7218773.1 hypothetical protein [Pseudomonas brassicacearum]